MNIKERRKRSIVNAVLAIVYIIAGFALAEKVAPEFLELQTVRRNGVVYYYTNNGFQWCSFISVLGCMIIGFGLKHMVTFCNMWGTSVNRSYKALEGTKLGLISFFMTCLNVFMLQYLVDMTEYDFKQSGDDAFAGFEQINVYLSCIFAALLLLYTMYNSLVKNKAKLSYIVTSLLGMFWSAFAVFIRAYSVKWLYLVYLFGVMLFMTMIKLSGDYVQPGVGYAKKGEGYNEHIAFFISNHGLGHMMRNIAVIEHILKTTDCTIVLVSDAPQISMAINYLEKQAKIENLDNRLICELMKTDFGLRVKSGSLLLDHEEIEKGIREYISELPNNGYNGVGIIDDYEVTKVVSDIVPYAFMSSSFRRLPSILMASFSWIEIYQEFLSEELIKPYKDSYKRATYVLRYALCNKPTRARFEDAIDVGYVCRPIDEAHALQIRSEYDFSKPIVYVSIGLSNDGIDLEPDVSDLPYTFITTAGVKLKGDNVFSLPKDCLCSQDYVKASDYCIIKSGWTTISECMIAGTPMALLGRNDVAEDRMSIEMLTEQGAAIKIEVDELLDMGAVMRKLEEYEFNITPQENDYKHIAEEILNLH